MMLLGACLVPLAMSGVVSLSAGTDQVETEGTAAERTALRDGAGEAGSGSGGGDEGGDVGSMGGSTNAGPLGSGETTTTTAPTAPTTTAAPTTTTTAPPTTEPAPEPEPTPGLPAPAAEVVQLVNDERAAASCGPLSVDTELTAAAQLHAEDMSARDYMDHVNPEGMDPSARAAAQGYGDPVGENIAMGYPDPQAVMEGWMNSEGHRNNILNCDYHVIGVGVDSDGWYWAQVFAF
jgi:uncharacterized protein YkwD